MNSLLVIIFIVVSAPFLFCFFLAEKAPTDKDYSLLCTSMSQLASVDSTRLQGWLSRMIMGSEGAAGVEDAGAGGSGKVQENRLLLQNLTTYIVKENRYNELENILGNNRERRKGGVFVHIMWD